MWWIGFKGNLRNSKIQQEIAQCINFRLVTLSNFTKNLMKKK